jgi:hypothetical protein
VKHKLQVIIGSIAVVVLAMSLLWIAARRVREARQFSQSYRVQTSTGTNYVVQLLETTVGNVETVCVVIVYARFENPNSGELVLPREGFVLVDSGRDTYRPTTSGAQAPLIRLPANGVLEKEALSYAVKERALSGALTLKIGHEYSVPINDGKPWTRRLPVGQFLTFRSRDW